MRIAPSLVFALLLAGFGASGCDNNPQHNFGDGGPEDSNPTESMPSNRSNRVSGTIDGRTFGPIEAAFISFPPDSHAEDTIPVLVLADYSFTCEQVRILLSHATLPETSDPATVVSVFEAGLYHYNAEKEMLLGVLEEETYKVIHTTGYELLSNDDGAPLALSGGVFFSNDGVISASYQAEEGYIEVEAVDLPDSVGGTFSLSCGSLGSLSGEFNVKECF